MNLYTTHSSKHQAHKSADGFRKEAGLTPKEQFWWGLFGGCMIVAFKAFFYASALSEYTPWPCFCFKHFILCAVWFTLPLTSGLVSRVCEPHHSLIAVFEGASAPMFFMVIAQHFGGI